jgi:hypothetical protein
MELPCPVMLGLMSKTSFSEVLEALKNSLRDFERVRMTAPDDPELLDFKREIYKTIKRAEDAVS